ncbi:MAG: UDP-3-O-(3-hydroxymyristoyl)glucosamine N-acyltransferase [Desulfovibrionaceae bacterium]
MEIAVSELAQKLGLEHRGEDVVVHGVSTLEQAGKSQLSFLAAARHVEKARSSQAGCLLVDASLAGEFPCVLASSNVYHDLARILTLFQKPRGDFQGVSDLAFIHPEAQLGREVTVYPFAYVGARTVLGDQVTVFPHSYIAEDCRVGSGTVIHPGVALMAGTELGERVVMQPGAVLGGDGFGYAQTARGHMKIPQLGRIRVGDEVEIGANAAIDRASLDATTIGAGTKIDNLVQIAHNVQMGEHCLIASLTGVAGSTKIGDFVVMGGQVGIADNLVVGNNVMLGAKTGVSNNVPDGFVGAGMPHMEKSRFQRTMAVFRKLPELFRRVGRLEKQIEQLSPETNTGGDNG